MFPTGYVLHWDLNYDYDWVGGLKRMWARKAVDPPRSKEQQVYVKPEVKITNNEHTVGV